MKRAKTVLRVLLVVVVGCAGALTMTACETVKGAGRDVSNLGEGVTDAAQGTQNAIDGKKK